MIQLSFENKTDKWSFYFKSIKFSKNLINITQKNCEGIKKYVSYHGSQVSHSEIKTFIHENNERTTDEMYKNVLNKVVTHPKYSLWTKSTLEAIITGKLNRLLIWPLRHNLHSEEIPNWRKTKGKTERQEWPYIWRIVLKFYKWNTS